MGLASALAAQQACQNASASNHGMPVPHSTPEQIPPQQEVGGIAASIHTGQSSADRSTKQHEMRQGMHSVILTRLSETVWCNDLASFYPVSTLEKLSQHIASKVDFHHLAGRWHMPIEMAVSLSALALYDIVIYADDSGSMASGDGERIEDLKLIVVKVAEVATLFDDDGIEVCFINADVRGNHIKTPDDVNQLISSVTYTRDTQLGTQLEAKILRPMAHNRRLAKPLLVITVTDGEPSDTPVDKIVSVIKECSKKMVSAGYGPNAVAFQFAQVGRDQRAQEFLASLDNHHKVGHLIDCTSYFELEQVEYTRKGVQLSVEAWLVKLMTGAVDRQMDSQDETGAVSATQHGCVAGTHRHRKGFFARMFG